MGDSVHEIIKMLKEELGPQWAKALLYIVSLAIVVGAIDLIYVGAIAPCAKIIISAIPLFTEQIPRSHIEMQSIGLSSFASRAPFGWYFGS